jgi:hypothetical protein
MGIAVCGPACTVVWEDGERKLSSYPIAPGRAHLFGGESPLRTRQGEMLAITARVSIARWNLKEAGGKALA